MDFERYTERARAAVQSAQTSALACGHPQILPEHLLKAMFTDRDRLALNLIRAAGGNPELAQRQHRQAARRPAQIAPAARSRA